MPANPDNRFVRTKIIATLGPASRTPERLAELLDAGLDVCRLNFSHGTLEEHGTTLATLRRLAEKRGQPICVIGDLCGPKIRLGECPPDGITLEAGQVVRIVAGVEACTAQQLTVSYDRIVDEVEADHRVLIDDGQIRLVVRKRQHDALVCEVLEGGLAQSHKGVNLPDSRLSTPSLTEKDRADLAWALEHEVDYIAMSFVRRPEDLYALKRAIKDAGRETPVIVKIEKPEALQHLDELIANTDAVLVARGDLGVETDLWRVPLAQKDMIERCRAAGVPVIVATQMLQSMIEAPSPTRAEVSDVANAIFDGADAVMLSGETAVGHHPRAAVDMMNRIAVVTGDYVAHRRSSEAAESTVSLRYRPTAAMAHAAVQAALDLGARLVAVWTATGTTARRVAKHRLPMPVLGLTYSEQVYRQLNLVYGVVPVRVEPMDNPVAMARALDRLLLERGWAAPQDLVVVVTSTRPTTPGATDTALVHRVGDHSGRPGAGDAQPDSR